MADSQVPSVLYLAHLYCHCTLSQQWPTEFAHNFDILLLLFYRSLGLNGF